MGVDELVIALVKSGDDDTGAGKNDSVSESGDLDIVIEFMRGTSTLVGIGAEADVGTLDVGVFGCVDILRIVAGDVVDGESEGRDSIEVDNY